MATSRPVPTVHLLGAGTYARNFIEKEKPVLQELRNTHALATIGFAEFNLKSMTYQPLNIDIPGVVNVTPPPTAIQTALGFSGDPAYAETLRRVWVAPAYAMVDKVIEVQQRLRIVGAEMLWLQGWRTGHSKPADELLRRLKGRDPSLFIATDSVLPEDLHQRSDALVGYKLFHQLHDDGITLVGYVSDNAGPFALANKLNVADDFRAVMFGSLLSASAQFGRTKTFAEISKALGKHSPFASFAFASRNIETFPVSLPNRFFGLFKKPPEDFAWVDHIFTEAKLATQTALTDPNARTIDEAINPEVPYFVVYTLPVEASNGWAWEHLSNEIRRYLHTAWPAASPVFCAGAGTPDPHYNGRRWLQVSVVFPIPPIPRPIQEALAHPPPRLQRDVFDDADMELRSLLPHAPALNSNHIKE